MDLPRSDHNRNRNSYSANNTCTIRHNKVNIGDDRGSLEVHMRELSKETVEEIV